MSGRFSRAFIACAVIMCALGLGGSLPAVAGGTLRVASDVSYAPLEFYRPDTKQIEGFDYDLAQALGKHLGETVQFRNHDFSTMIPDLKAGKFDVVVSAMSDTRAREKDVDFVDYLLSGSGILTRAGNPSHLWDLSTLCGHRIALEKGTSQELAVAHQQDACKAIGLGSISVLAAPTDEAALKTFAAGKSDAHISDYPVVSYVARTTDNGKAYTVVGHPFGIVPFGIAVAKTNTGLRDRVQKALLDVIRDGTYDTLLRRWGLEQGALRSAPVNAGTKYER